MTTKRADTSVREEMAAPRGSALAHGAQGVDGGEPSIDVRSGDRLGRFGVCAELGERVPWVTRRAAHHSAEGQLH